METDSYDSSKINGKHRFLAIKTLCRNEDGATDIGALVLGKT